MQSGRAREKELDVIVQLGHGSNGRPGGPHGVVWSMAIAGGTRRYGRRAACPFCQELSRVGGKRFNVTALPFGIDGVEGKGGFPGAADARDNVNLFNGTLRLIPLRLCCRASSTVMKSLCKIGPSIGSKTPSFPLLSERERGRGDRVRSSRIMEKALRACT